MKNKALVAGSSAMMILELIQNEDMYGYQITEQLRTRSENAFEMKAGTLYPILHSLEKDELVTSYEKSCNGKLRKYYSITPKGKEMLDSKKKDWTEFINAVLKVMGGKDIEGI